MSESCEKCRNYTADIGDKGYCKLYRHETNYPEKVCPRYELRDSKEWKNVLHIDKVKELVNADTSKELYKQTRSRMLYSISVLCTAIISIFLLIFSVTLGVVLATFTEISLLHRIIFILLVGSFVISVIVILGMLISKFRFMRLIVPVVTLFAIIFMFLFSDAVWFDFHVWIMKLTETIFYVAV